MGQKCCSICFVRLTTFRQDSDSNRDLWDRKYPPQPTVCHTWVTCYRTVGTIYKWNSRDSPTAWHVFALSVLSICDLEVLVCTIYIWNDRYISTCVKWNGYSYWFYCHFLTLLAKFHYKASLSNIPFNKSSEMSWCYISLLCNLYSKMKRMKKHRGEVHVASMYTIFFIGTRCQL